MAERVAHEQVLEETASDIEAIEKQIYQLRIEFAALLLDGAPADRLEIFQRLAILQAHLKLLRIRRMYASAQTP